MSDIIEDENSERIEVDDKEILESVKLKPEKDEEAAEKDEDLHQMFSSFLVKRAEIKENTETIEMIPSGFQLLDAILGGGFPIGAFTMIVGQPGSGKSMLAYQVLASAQKQYKGNLLGTVLDSEESATKIRLASLGVINPPINPYRDITVEKVFKFLEGLSLFKLERELLDTPSVVIWDSIANTLSQKELETDDINSVIGYKARLLSLLVPKFVKKCSATNICWIAVNQLRDNVQIGKFPQPKDFKFMKHNKKIPGGNVLKFNAFHLIDMKVDKVIDSDKYGFEGIQVYLTCVKNKAFTPNINIKLLGSFTNGFSDFWTNYQLLVDTKRLNAASWNHLLSYPERKFRTKEAEQLYNKDESFRKAFDKAVQETLQTDYIDKYSPEILQDQIQTQ